MNGKELEIKRRFKAGDMVVFRLGERENQICPHCGANSYDSQVEARLVSLTRKVFEVEGTWAELKQTGEDFRICVECRGEMVLPNSDYVLLDFHTYPNGQMVRGFVVYERELSPVSMENKNEMYRYLYGGLDVQFP